MKIRKLKLYSADLQSQKDFYIDTLGFKIVLENKNHFSVEIGHTTLTFEYSSYQPIYHYCFLIPSNKMGEAINWLKSRLEIIKIEGDQIIVNQGNWNADSVYFYDGNGHIVELIARYDLDNNLDVAFDQNQILNVNEIGMPTTDIERLNNQLETALNTHFWKGDFERFGTNGSQNGLFLLVNNTIKKAWFPTNLFPQMAPFEATIEVKDKLTPIKYKEGVLIIEPSI